MIHVYADWTAGRPPQRLDVDESDNALDLDLARSVAAYFRVKDSDAAAIIGRHHPKRADGDGRGLSLGSIARRTR